MSELSHIGEAVERGELSVHPRVDVVRANVTADRLDPPSPFICVHLQRAVNRLRLRVHVERIHGDYPLTKLGVRTCVFR